tara:strand:+ start:76 stop:351 length:276 start_codon:yes stop_codon:yes gene_type:complete
MYHLEILAFGYMHNILYIIKKVTSKYMGFKASNTIIKTETKTQSQSDIQLSETEIVTLLSLVKRSTFSGEDIESLYNLVLKLQQQYVNIKK